MDGDRTFRAALAGLLLAALLVRALIPAGWMPGSLAGMEGAGAETLSLTIHICTQDGPQTRAMQVPVTRDNAPAPEPAADTDESCPFAVLGGGATMPDAPFALAQRITPEQPRIAALRALWLTQPRRLLPPGRAPPALV
jgi:hypothetical protein